MFTSAFRIAMTASFDPRSLAPLLWLSDTGSDPGAWADLSGNGFNATQATAGAKPAIIAAGKNGLQARRFDGGDWLSCGDVCDIGTGSQTVFVAHKFATTGNGYFLTKSLAAGAPARWGMGRDTTMLGFYAEGVTNYIASYADPSTAGRIVSNEINRTAGSVTLRENGVLKSSVAALISSADLTTTFRLLVGAYNNATDTGEVIHFDGDIYEILIYPRALTANERQAVERYLSSKWAIPLV